MITLLTLIFTGDPQDLNKFQRQAATKLRLKTTAVFNEQDKNYLKKLKKDSIAHSFSISLPKNDLQKIKKEITKNRYKINFEIDQKITANTVDPHFNEQWGLKNLGKAISSPISPQNSVVYNAIAGEDVGLPQSISKSKKSITVAVIDSGVDVKHPDLVAAITQKPDECKSLAEYQACLKKDSKKKCDETWLKVDNDKNGFPLDCNGWNFIGPKNPISNQYGGPILNDDIGHGTHVAGIIAAQENNIGVRGIAPETKILPVQVITEDPSAGDGGIINGNEEDFLKATKLTQTVARGILYAIQSNVDIINLSLGWNGRADSPLVRDLIKTAREKNILVVAAAGNDGTDALAFPCQYSDVICVGAHNPDGAVAEFSNYGSGVDLAAPGVSILSTIPMALTSDLFTDERGYEFKEGTSMATPFVSGALAFLLSQKISPQNAFVKLLTGTRTRPLVEQKATHRGNLDLQGALNSKPQPLFVPEQKGVLPFIWDGKSTSLPISIPIKNLGTHASDVSIELTVPEKFKNQNSVQILNPKQKIDLWDSQQLIEFPFMLEILSPKISSDIILSLEIKAKNQKAQWIRIPLQISIALEKLNPPENSITVPIIEGQWIGDEESGSPTLLTIESLDQSSFQDYLAILYGPEEWTLQLVQETAKGYVLGVPKKIPAIDGGIRTPKRVDLNFDGQSEYVLTYLVAPEEEPSTDPHAEPKAQVPYFRFDWLDKNLNDVYPSYTFKNKTTVLNLDKYQWIKNKNRLVPAWVDFGKLPIIERPTKFDPWDPKPNWEKRAVKFRIYYHDPYTEDGVRSIKVDTKLKPFSLLAQSKEQVATGKFFALSSDSANYGSGFSTFLVSDTNTVAPLQKVNLLTYRNLSAAEGLKTVFLNPDFKLSSTSFIGGSGPQSQRATTLVPQTEGSTSSELILTPNSPTQFAYRIIGAYLDQNANLSGYAQSDYEVLYKDASSLQTFETSLQRYTFLPSSIFERSFVSVVAESDGERLAALQIPDGFGAYPGAEIIAPLKDQAGQTIDLIKPAKLRIQIADSDCDWLKSLEASKDQPSQAVYYCGDRFIRVPYKF